MKTSSVLTVVCITGGLIALTGLCRPTPSIPAAARLLA